MLISDSINKIADIRDLLKHCTKVVGKLHFKGHLIDEELQKKKVKEDVHELLDKMSNVNSILDIEQKTALSSGDDIDNDNSEPSEALAGETKSRVHKYKHLQQGVITRWNSAYEMINSWLALKDEEE